MHTCCQARYLFRVNFTDRKQSQLGTSIGVEDSAHGRHHQVLPPTVDVASDARDMVGHIPQGAVAREDSAAALLFSGITTAFLRHGTILLFSRQFPGFCGGKNEKIINI